MCEYVYIMQICMYMYLSDGLILYLCHIIFKLHGNAYSLYAAGELLCISEVNKDDNVGKCIARFDQ